MIKTFLLALGAALLSLQSAAQLISPVKTGIELSTASIVVDQTDFPLVKKAAEMLQQDIAAVSGKKIPIIHSAGVKSRNNIFIGTVGKARFLQSFVKEKRLAASVINQDWEAYQVQTIAGNLVIAGSDRRGSAFGVLELCKQIGVSPWYWWADVPRQKKAAIYINTSANIIDAPKVKYRGIFINDEAPALSNWSKEKFGGFNHKFYAKVFELMLRLKANYIWPAMWGNAFYDDDSLNIQVADEYGIVIGTSHHEPLMRAHDEWRRYGNKQKWNYDSTKAGLQTFWRGGMGRAWNEKIVSLGMRGDGDEPMSRETATSLLERIVKDQREIIADVTGKPAEQTPQLWALYKEVQDYYDKGMRVPDDVTLLLCDDNWGNLRKLPKPADPLRKGGYGIYYHFDYVGGPRNYKWINTNPLPRIWEQLHLAWEHNVRNIWIVNVGDIKPMELPISFFLDYAWDPAKIGPADLQRYTEKWAAEQFGRRHATAIAEILSKYAKYTSRRKPELLDAGSFNLENGEWDRVVDEYSRLKNRADSIERLLPSSFKTAYYQLVRYPVAAMENLYQLYYSAALNKKFANEKNLAAHWYAEKVKERFLRDSMLSLEYHRLNDGKWNHLMSQTHIGYTNWQQPPYNKMPAVFGANDPARSHNHEWQTGPPLSATTIPTKKRANSADTAKYISIAADHFTKAIGSNGITWKVLPDHGRTGSAVTTFPVTAPAQTPTNGSPHLQYDIHTKRKDSCTIYSYFSPTLNFHRTENGLQFAISVDDETPQVISINKEDKNSISGVWNKWVAENIIIKTSRHAISKPGKHTVKYWMVNSGVVLQKLVLNFGGMPSFYLGPPTSSNINNHQHQFKAEYMNIHTLKTTTITVMLSCFGYSMCLAQTAVSHASLKEAYKNDFLIGTALNTRQIEEKDPKAATLILQQFNAITPENCMKAENIHPGWDKYDFTLADKIVTYGKQHSLAVNGHTLIWHSQLPLFARKIASVDSFRLFFTNHISTIASRYSGKVFSWDVVNEALNEDGSMRKSVFLQKLGDNYVTEAFRLAQQHSPNTELYYNDYNNEQPQKRAGCIALVKKVQAAGVRIDGVGIQGHWHLGKVPLKDIEASILAYHALGLKVMFTEVDIEMLPRTFEGADVNQTMAANAALNPYKTGIPDSLLQQQAKDYENLFRLFLKHKDKITRVTFWGVNDGQSWLNGWPVPGRTNYPLLFDRAFTPKPAYHAVLSLKN